MIRMKTLTVLATLLPLLAAAPLPAQSTAELKRELRQRESEAQRDADALVDVADWAKEKGLIRDRRRILQKALRLDPDNARAHHALGFVKYDGEWMPEAKAELARRKAREKEMKAKGMVEVDGVWVTEEEVEDAKKGIFRHDGERVSAAEKKALVAGMVRHPRTGRFIPEEDLPRAESGMFPLAGDEWGDLEAANRYHSNPERPWVFRSYSGWVVGNRSLEELEGMASDFDSGLETAARVFQGTEPAPGNHPVVLVANSDDHYRELGNAVGAEGSAHAVFLAQADMELPQLGMLRPVITNFAEDWGPYWLRHAAGLGHAAAMARQANIDAPVWFLRGVAGYAERHYVPGVAAHFGRQHLEKGGVRNIDSWFDRFEISGNLEARMIDFNIYQAGLVIDFAMSGKDDAVTEAMLAVTEAFQERDARAGARALETLKQTVIRAEEALRDHFQDVLEQG